jgi:hypothetical protein
MELNGKQLEEIRKNCLITDIAIRPLKTIIS